MVLCRLFSLMIRSRVDWHHWTSGRTLDTQVMVITTAILYKTQLKMVGMIFQYQEIWSMHELKCLAALYVVNSLLLQPVHAQGPFMKNKSWNVGNYKINTITVCLNQMAIRHLAANNYLILKAGLHGVVENMIIFLHKYMIKHILFDHANIQSRDQ